MGSHRHLIFAAVCLVAMATGAASCKASKPDDGEAEADRQVAELRRQAKWDEQPTGVKQEPVLVTQNTPA